MTLKISHISGVEITDLLKDLREDIGLAMLSIARHLLVIKHVSDGVGAVYLVYDWIKRFTPGRLLLCDK